MNVMAFPAILSQLCSTAEFRRIADRLQGLAESVRRQRKPRASGGRSVPVAAPEPATLRPHLCVQDFIDQPQQVARVDDPDGVVSLLAVRGEIGQSTVGQLHESLADLCRGRFVHLDLASSSIRTSEAMRSLELIADDLEQRGIVLRVVGLDPQHPMLSPSL